jgi:transcriptional regulator with XRE-family HTH domain
MDEKGRIEEVVKHTGMNARQFASEIDLNPSTLSHVLSGRNNPSLDIMQKILKTFPNISPEWLILEQGTMFRKKNDSQMLSLFEPEEENTLLSGGLSPKKEEKTEEAHKGFQEKAEKNTFSEQNPPENINRQTEESIVSPAPLQIKHKNITKIIVYFSDNTFQELQ